MRTTPAILAAALRYALLWERLHTQQAGLHYRCDSCLAAGRLERYPDADALLAHLIGCALYHASVAAEPPSPPSLEQRILDVVFAKGTTISPSQVNRNDVIVVNGLTGADSRGKSAAECFGVLFLEEDGGGSPGRLGIYMTERGPVFKIQHPTGPVESPPPTAEALEAPR